YDGEEHSIELGGLDTLPDGVTYVYVYDEEESSTPFKFTDAGIYEITIKFTGSEEYAPISDKKATLTISAADFDTSTLNFVGREVVYDGEEHSISIDNLPEWLTVEYEGNGVSEVGEHKVKVKFTHSNGNYNAISDMEVVLKISADEFDVNSLVFEDTTIGYDGKPHSIEIENLPEWLTVEYEGNGQTEIGSYVITAKFTHSNPNYGEISPITATLTIEKGKIAKPVYKGDIRYSGESILPDVSDFDNYIEGLIEIVIDKSEAGVFVGKYTIVFAIVDTELYEWEEGDTKSIARINKVSVNGNAILALADEISLEENEIAVEWSIGKAKLTATKKDGALPVFSSTSYKGSMDEVITYKYYTDKECTEEIAQEEIVAGQTYYVKASLEDSDNFELDATAIKFVGTSFSYDAPAGELSIGEKIVEFLKKNWLWLVIALVALLVLIIIIVLIARRKKDDNNGKGNNNPPYPPYNGGQPPYPPYNGGQPPYPPYGQQPPYGGQPPYYDRMRAPIMPMAGMMQGSMQPTMNGAMQPQIGMQQLQGNQMQGSQPQVQALQQPNHIQYVESGAPALNAPSHVEAHISESGVNMLVEEVHRLRSDIEHIKSKSEEENIKLRSEVENARAMSAVESAK
ncbi:MAG: hypothetical protein K2I79_01215, partial [Clostridia bacterium]|nr:hypothetical protein [Clostridia bacterium]